ncbi:uncharacterized protein LOC107731918 [Sinocyclocheilus rhinocerous]|uniref:uncharacterized protein LOC107731918 n=1 Tax=Sinocyclocheilus rhinocerous TaxID=307959 RepID=UPI0007BA950A|nr:PREDICTED: uncharacterized protein LOC107731918 [Sinocyclocheilus rhinocerous]
MSPQYYLRLALVGLTVSVVGCLPDASIVPLGDLSDDSEIKIQVLENFKSVSPPIQSPVRGRLQGNVEQFNSKYQLPRINSASYSQRNDGNAKNPSFSPTDIRASADVIFYHSVPNKVQSNTNSRNNPVEFSSVKFNDGIDAKRSYALQTVRQEQNPLDFKGSQMSSSDPNMAPRLVRKNGGMHAANVRRSGSFGYQHILKSEMPSESLRLNEPYLRENIPTNYMSRSSTVNQMRHKSDGNMLFGHLLQNRGQNQKVLRNTSPSIVRPNQQDGKPLPHAFSAGTGVISQISYENTRDVALSKVYTPPTIPTPIFPGFMRSNSNRGHGILPFKKSLMFSSQHDHVKPSSSERVASPSTKSATSSYTFKDIHLTSTQNDYQNRGQSSQNLAPIQTFHSQKEYGNLATGISAFRPSVTNNARSSFLSNENSGIQMSALLDRSKQNTDLTPQMQFAKNTMLLSERAKNRNLPYPTNHSLKKPSQHNIRNRTDLNSFGQSAVQSLFFKNDPAPSLVPGKIIESVHSVSPSVSGTQGTSENSGTSSSRNRPYYLTSKMPYAFKGFTFVPTLQTSLQKTEMHSGQKPLSNSNVQYAPARPHTTLSALAQKPLIRESYQKTLFQFKDIETSQEKQFYLDQTDSFDNGPQHETVSSTLGASNPMSNAPKHHVVKGQAVVMKTSLSGTNTSSLTNNGAVFLQNHPKIGYGGLTVDEVQSKTSQRWTSSMLASAPHTESNQGEIPAVTSSNTSFVGPNSYDASIKSRNGHENPTSELKSSLMNKVTGYPQIHNAVIQPLRRYSLKGHKGLLNPTMEVKDGNTAGITQSNITEYYSPIRLRPTSSAVISRWVEVTQEGKRSEENTNHQNVYAIPTYQSAIYRSADINSHKTNSSAKLTYQLPIHRSAIKTSGKANVIQAQGSRPTSSFVVGRYINTFDKTSTKSNLNLSSTKTGLNNYKPVQFSDIAGSASFTNAADTTAKKEVDPESEQNGSNSTSVMEESFKELLFDNSMISALQNETDESTMDLSVPELMPTAAIDFTTESQLPFTEEYTLPQPTVYSSESQLDLGNLTTSTAEGTYPLFEETLILNTTLLVKLTSD